MLSGRSSIAHTEVRMTRPKTRRTLRLESLESRALLSSGGPTAEQQYMLELINMARTNPAADGRPGSSRTSTPTTRRRSSTTASTSRPSSSAIAQLDRRRSRWPGTTRWPRPRRSRASTRPTTRSRRTRGPAGRAWSSGSTRPATPTASADGENSYAYANSVDHAMKAFLIDWGVSDQRPPRQPAPARHARRPDL